MRTIPRTTIRAGFFAGAVIALSALAAIPASAAPAAPALPALSLSELATGPSQVEQAHWRPGWRRCHIERRCWRNRWGRVHCRPIRVCRGRW